MFAVACRGHDQHHVLIGTHEDNETARRGESIWAFMPRWGHLTEQKAAGLAWYERTTLVHNACLLLHVLFPILCDFTSIYNFQADLPVKCTPASGVNVNAHWQVLGGHALDCLGGFGCRVCSQGHQPLAQ